MRWSSLKMFFVELFDVNEVSSRPIMRASSCHSMKELARNICRNDMKERDVKESSLSSWDVNEGDNSMGWLPLVGSLKL